MVERRLLWLAGFVLVWGGAIFTKLFTLQVVHHQEFVHKARKRQEELVQLRAQRGAILDRTGQPLAMSIPVETVTVDPRNLPSIGFGSNLLARELHLDASDLMQRISAARDDRRGFFVVKKEVTDQEAEDVENLRLDWIHVDPRSQRHYPNERLAAHVLGGVDFSGKGVAGIEKQFENELHGASGSADILKDVHNRGIFELAATQAHQGVNITLTIHERLQFVAEREIAQAVQQHGAVSGSVVVMNPYTGEILALASYPPYDPNTPPQNQGEVDARANHAVGVPFEPGSCFKVITLSAALETTTLGPNSPINCHGGVLTVAGHRVIHDSHGGLGFLPMSGVLAHSSNIGAIEIGRTVGRDNMYEYMRRFGFGERTGIPLPAESRGKVRAPNTRWWGSSTLESVSMGQEVSVTTLQLARAVSVVANGGLLVKPQLVLKLGDQALPVEPPVRAIKPETAITMRQMMEGVVLNGTGRGARLDGYTSGGKTGTAQIYDFANRYYTHTYNGSFIGFAPVTNPAVVVAVTLNGTRGTSGFGGEVAAPVFKIVTMEALRILDVPKDLPENTPKNQIAQNQSYDDVSIPDLGTDQPNILDDGDGDDATPPHPAVFAGPVAPKAPEPPAGTAPNFKGMTLRAVLAAAAQKGIQVQPAGSGTARVQDPPAGTALHPGERIRVQFAR